MDRNSVEALLEEARSLAVHAVRTGRLPPNSRLFEEIDAVAATLREGAHPSVTHLVTEVQKASRATHTSMAQLAQQDRLAARVSRMAAIVMPYLLGLLTLLLTMYLAFQSSELHKADMALREYQSLESERLPEKLYHAWKLYRYERVLNANGPALAQLDGYQQLVVDSKRLYEKRLAVLGLLTDAANPRYVPGFVSDLVSRWSAPPQGPALLRAAGDGSAPGELPRLMPAAIDCSKEVNLPQHDKPQDAPALFGSKQELDDFRNSVDCFLQALQIESDYDYPMYWAVYPTRNKVNLLVSWMLPALYGLLGACVFLMREILLGNTLRGAHGHARMVDMLSLLLRVALGGLAGIIIGWFWVPSAPVGAPATIAVSSLSFGVAFLAGFSIDSLFGMLDRLTKNFRQTDDDKPADVAKPADSKS